MGILNTFDRLIHRRAIIRKAQTDTVADFVGCEVLERQTGSVYAVAIITAIEWNSSVLPLGWQVGQPQGDWMIKIRYIATGYEHWTSQAALQLTGDKYEDKGNAIFQQAHDTQARIAVQS